MIFSILDTDLYKFSTSYAYMKLFPDAECTFTFIDRNSKHRKNPEFLDTYLKLLHYYCNIGLEKDEFEWCVTNIPYIPRYYWEWLKQFRFEFNKVNIYLDADDILHIEVTDKCYKATLYEILCLFLVTEVESKLNERVIDLKETYNNTLSKVIFANDNFIKFSEFGTRRRYNYDIQNKVLDIIKNYSETCTGTSNVHFAMKYNMKPIGTHPHEWFMFHGAQFGYRHANYLALENWVNVYDGNLGIALTDTFTSKVFFNNFSMKHAKLFDGIRQDSGDEMEFLDNALIRYKQLGIDPTTKTIVFSNGLNFEKCLEIQNHCEGLIKCAFGIGTNLTNDVFDISKTRLQSENIVMKMSQCRMSPKQEWRYCTKISDDTGKAMGEDYNVAKLELGLKTRKIKRIESDESKPCCSECGRPLHKSEIETYIDMCHECYKILINS